MGDITALRDRARFVVPGPPDSLVPRTRLDEHYRSASGRVVRVLAPAGYGKSTLVARWVEDEVRVVRWLDLQRVDNDPEVLFGALVRGLADLVDDAANDDVAPTRSLEEVAIPSLRRAVRSCPTPFVLVLDDVHLIDDTAALALITAVAESVPDTSTVVLVGRAHHELDDVPRMRLAPGVVDLAAEDLAFDLAETERFLVANGMDVDVADLTLLDEQFAGWPAGLRLACLALAAHGGRAPTPLAEVGEVTYVTDYLRAEWLANLDEDDRRFLMEAACLGRFTPALCDAVLDRRGSAEVIRRLDRDRLVVLPLDRRGGWYRLHALLGRWLSTELRHQDQGRWREVHLDAARWWEREGDVDLALEHLALAGDLDRYGQVVLEHAGAFITRGQSATVGRWLSTLPAGQVRASQGLCAVEAVQAITVGDGPRALRWTRYLASAASSAESTTPWSSWADVIQASLEVRPAAELLPAALHAHKTIESGPWRAYACLTLGGLLAVTGDERSAEVLAEGASEGAVAGSPTAHVNCLAMAAIVTGLTGDPEVAAEIGAEAVDLMATYGFEHVPTAAAPVVAVRAMARARSGQHDRAADDVAEVRQILTGMKDVAPWYNVLVRLTIARTCLLIDQPETAWTLLREAERYLVVEPADLGIAEHVRLLRDQAQVARRLFNDRSWSLTSAELRVVRYLPTNLSLGDIAGRLYVSRNTVKSHTSSIYRKLGTTSRSGAVELARQAGLLDTDGIDGTDG